MAGASFTIQRSRDLDAAAEGISVTAIGAATSSAGCGEIRTEPAAGKVRHVDGQRVDYADSPPAYGSHWSSPAEFDRTYYDDVDRPELERLVQQLEQGYTIVWYDATVAADEAQLQAIENLAAVFAADANRVIAAPWTSNDGDPFPHDTHVALTHWAIEGDDARQGQGMGVWQYCDRPSGEVLADFVEQYPYTNSPEPDGEGSAPS